MLRKLNFKHHCIQWLQVKSRIAGLIVCIFLTKTNPTFAFYLLPTRAWELLSGCILATYPFQNSKRMADQRIDIIFSNIGLLLIGFSIFFIHEGVSFPGFIAVFPVIGVVFLIGRSSSPEGLAEQLMSSPLMVFIGKISYSLFLWHWPIYCFVDYSLYSSLSVIRLALKIILTTALSLVSYLYFEKPIRLYLNQPKSRIFGFTAFSIGVIVLFAIGYFIRTDNYVNAQANSVKNGGITFNQNQSKPVIVLMGDSNGAMYGKILKEIAIQLNAKVHVVSVSAGNPFPGSELYLNSMLLLSHEKPDITIFVASWVDKIGTDRVRLTKALSEILKHSQHVILITQPPNLPDYASRQKIREFGRRPIFEELKFSALRKKTNTFLVSLNSDRIHILEIDHLFVAPNGEIRFTDIDKRQIYQDSKHLSGYGSLLVKHPLEVKIAQILTSSSPQTDINPRYR